MRCPSVDLGSRCFAQADSLKSGFTDAQMVFQSHSDARERYIGPRYIFRTEQARFNRFIAGAERPAQRGCLRKKYAPVEPVLRPRR